MKSKFLKGILAIILLTVSPLIVLVLVGILYVMFRMINGVSFTASVQSFINFIYSLGPYFSYLTTIPVIAVTVTLFIKNRRKFLSILKKR